MKGIQAFWTSCSSLANSSVRREYTTSPWSRCERTIIWDKGSSTCIGKKGLRDVRSIYVINMTFAR